MIFDIDLIKKKAKHLISKTSNISIQVSFSFSIVNYLIAIKIVVDGKYDSILWSRNNKTCSLFNIFLFVTTTIYQLLIPDNNNWVTRINRESSLQ